MQFRKLSSLVQSSFLKNAERFQQVAKDDRRGVSSGRYQRSDSVINVVVKVFKQPRVTGASLCIHLEEHLSLRSKLCGGMVKVQYVH